MCKDDDLPPTTNQIRKLIQLGAYNERSKYLTRQGASDLIAQVMKQKEQEHHKCHAEQAAINKKYAGAWKWLQQREKQFRQDESEEMHARLFKM